MPCVPNKAWMGVHHAGDYNSIRADKTLKNQHFYFYRKGNVFRIEKPHDYVAIELPSSPCMPLTSTAKPYTENLDMGIPDTGNTAQ